MRVLAARVLVLAEHVLEAALAVGASVQLEGFGVLHVVLAVVDLAEGELASISAGIGLHALAIAVARGDGPPVLGARDAVDVLAVAEAAVPVRLSTVLEDGYAAVRNAVGPHRDGGLKLAAAL